MNNSVDTLEIEQEAKSQITFLLAICILNFTKEY